MAKEDFSPASDAELMRAYLNGDATAFEVLYRRHSGRVYGYLRKRTESRQVADEVFQNVFLKLHQSRHHYDFAYTFTQWLFVVAKTSLLDHFRKAGRQIQLADEELNEDHVSREPTSQTYSLGEEKELDALKHVSSEQREVIEMRVIDELSYEEIATKLNRSQDSIRQIVSRGLKKLRSLRGSS